MTNYEKMFKQLFVLNDSGIYLTIDSGHTWIENTDESSANRHLMEAGISVNNKIYGGIAQALDVMDEALQRAGCSSLVEVFDMMESDGYVIGKGGIDESRIDKTNKNEGGMY